MGDRLTGALARCVVAERERSLDLARCLVLDDRDDERDDLDDEDDEE